MDISHKTENSTSHRLIRAITSICVDKEKEDSNVLNIGENDQPLATIGKKIDQMDVYCDNMESFSGYYGPIRSPSVNNLLNLNKNTSEEVCEKSHVECLTNEEAFPSHLIETSMNEYQNSRNVPESMVNTSGILQNPFISLQFDKMDDKKLLLPPVAEALSNHEYEEDSNEKNKNDDDENDDVDSSAGLRELLHKLFNSIKIVIPLKADSIQELLDRQTDENIPNDRLTNISNNDIEEGFIKIDKKDVNEFETVMQHIFLEFEKEWISYQTMQEHILDEMFMHGVQAASQTDKEAESVRYEATSPTKQDVPTILHQAMSMINVLRRERSVLAKYIIEKQHEWGALREGLSKEIAILRKDNSRLLSNKVGAVHSNGKGSKISPFSQRALESMVHAKFSLDKAFALDIAKQTKINELKLIIFKQQEQIRELQQKAFDDFSRSSTDDVVNSNNCEQSSQMSKTENSDKDSDSEILNYIIKEMSHRVLNRDDVDNSKQILYCDEHSFLPEMISSPDIASLKVYCMGGTWRTNIDLPVLNNRRPQDDSLPPNQSEGRTNETGDSTNYDDKVAKTAYNDRQDCNESAVRQITP